jgi:DNA-binding NtrC family response regulator
VEEFERRHIAFALGAAAGNRERAARLLDIDPATLYRRLIKYDLH